ncbi:MAG: hypothetical protein ACK4GN_14455 [Runella sp.]
MKKTKIAKTLAITAALAGGLAIADSFYAEAQTYWGSTNFKYQECVQKNGKKGGECVTQPTGCLTHASCG